MNDPRAAGEEFEDVVEDMVSSASPLEADNEAGGTDEAGRDGDAALGDDEAFNA